MISRDFENLYQSLSDACDSGVIDGDTYDLILSTMSEIYAEDARAIAIAAREIEPDDPVTPDANLADLFAAVALKEQFTQDFRNAIKLAPSAVSSGDLAAQLIGMR